MKEDVRIFLESDILERYLLGTTTIAEGQQVERYLLQYPEVRKTYTELQENLERYANTFSKTPPPHLKEAILKNIKATSTKESKGIPWYSIVASIAAVFFGILSFMFWKQNTLMSDEQKVTIERVEALNEQLQENYDKLNKVEQQFLVLNNPRTSKYILKAEVSEKPLQTLAYINPSEQKSYVYVADLPELPNKQVFQLWADVDGHMISLDILEETENGIVEVPFKTDMESLNITIEPAGGSDEATVENLVANVVL